MSYPTRIPKEIEEKVRMLKYHQDLINELNMKVEMSKRECERLEQELAAYRLSVPSIRQVPREILVDIFKRYIFHNPRHIRRLLLVCKLWHNIVITEPRLWTIIQITVDTREIYAKQAVTSLEPYVDACLKHSANLPLTLDLDFGNVIALDDHSKALRNFEMKQKAPITFGDEDWANFMKGSVGKAWHNSHIISLLRRLLGKSGEAMIRWSKLKLTLPRNMYLRLEMWECFVGPTPKLTSLQIHTRDYGHLRIVRVFPNLSALHQLHINETTEQYGLDVHHAAIKSLSIEYQIFHTLHDYQLERYTSLTTLEIKTGNQPWPTNQRNPEVTVTVTLPLVTKIAFIGGYVSIRGMEFLLPSLKHLHIERGDKTFFKTLPSVDPTSVSWFIVETFYPLWKEEEKEEALREVLLHYQRMETFTTSVILKDCLLRVVAELTQQGKMPLFLVLIRFEGDSGDEEMDPRAI